VSGGLVESNGAELFYEEHGAGPPLVLIHGAFCASAAWNPVLPQLDGLRVITPDSRGHGRSSNPGGTLSYAQLADDVAALIEALGLERPVVGGYSDGGQVTLEFGARHPGVARGLVIGAALPDLDPIRESLKAFLGADDTGTPDVAAVDATFGDSAETLRSWHPGGEEQWRRLVVQTAPMWLDYEGLAPDALAAIEAPALVLAGDRDDELAPLDAVVALYRALPNGELAICPMAGHVTPVTRARAGIFGALVRDFVARQT
jgi:pimeloyl-ACP methyl ester carboxylesterase